MNSLWPLVFSTWWANLDAPHTLPDQNFGIDLRPEQLMLPPNYLLWMKNNMPLGLHWRPWSDKGETGFSTISADKDNYKVILDVQQFKPEELNVKVVDKFVIVEAKHEEKRDEHGYISRQFVRRYLLPDQVDIDKVSSNISSDGVLTITAPLKEKLENKNEKVIKIEQTGKPALKKEGEKKETTTAKTSTEETTTPNAEATTNPPK